MKEALTNEQINHPLNETLLKEASEIKSERKTLKERLEKLEETRSGVSAAVYQKVRADYIAKLNKTMERLSAIKKTLEQEQKSLVQKKNLVEVSIQSHQEQIEESKLRHALGEFTAQQYQEVVQRETNEVKRLEEALKALDQGLEKHREIFEGEEMMPAKKPEDTTSRIKLEQESTDRVREPAAPPALATPSKKAPELQVYENGKVAYSIPIDKTIHIGRSPANEVPLKEPKVSRKHAEIQCVGGKFVLMDLESSNGTFIGGKKVTEQILQPNDEILIGNTKMVFKI